METETEKLINIVLFGSGGVGKMSAVLMQYNGTFVDGCSPCIEESYQLKIKINKKEIVFDATVTAGQTEYAGLWERQAKNGDGFIIMYSLIDVKSFYGVQCYYELIKEIKGNTYAPIVICGNKCDLQEDRLISKREGEELAQILGAKFFETSAIDNINIREMFETIIKMVINKDEMRDNSVKRE